MQLIDFTIQIFWRQLNANEVVYDEPVWESWGKRATETGVVVLLSRPTAHAPAQPPSRVVSYCCY